MRQGLRCCASFNAIVNDLKDSSTDVKKYTAILEEISHKEKLKVSGSLSSALGDEGNVASTETTYDPLVQNRIITKKNFPTNGAEYVSNLTDSDVKSIKIEKVNKVNYLSPLPDSFTYQNVNYDLAPIKNTAFPEAYKITIVLNEEKVDDITKTVSGTSVFDKIYVTDYRATIESLRKEITSSFDSLTNELKDYCKTKTSGSIKSNLTVEYYIDTNTFAPLGAKYSYRFDFSYRIKLYTKIDVLEATPLIDMTQDMYMLANAYYLFPGNLPA